MLEDSSTGLRQRKKSSNSREQGRPAASPSSSSGNANSKIWQPHEEKHGDTTARDAPSALLPPPPPPQPSVNETISQPLSYDCAETVILQGLAVIFLIAFLAAWYQNQGLLADDGIMPARITYWEPLQQGQFANKSSWQGFLYAPSLFWWIPLTDFTLQAVPAAGVVLSATIVVATGGRTTWMWQALLWLLYFSIVSTADATSFYAYGWESQLLETTFLSIFLCPLPGWYQRNNNNNNHQHPQGNDHHQQQQQLYLGLWPPAHSLHARSPIPRWLFRWLMFRITLGAGLIKRRGSSCWMKKTCLYYHFETQPIPSPLSFVYHFLPPWVHRRLIDIDFLVQYYTSWFVLVPPVGWVGRTLLRAGGILQTGLMLGIIASGNFSFLNHLTILPALACLDDACWPRWWRRLVVGRLYASPSSPAPPLPLWRRAVDICLLCTIGYLSWPVLTNLWESGQRQVMNRSFDNFRLVNTYGAFGSVGEKRYEPIISISYFGTDWTELEFPCKPGNVYWRPCFCAPYHYRLDWNIWFLGFKPHKAMLNQREQWLYQLVAKLLQEELDQTKRPWLDLLDSSTSTYLRKTYYDKGQAPRYAKVDMYRYRMTASLATILTSPDPMPWWNRTFAEPLIPVVEYDPSTKRLKRVTMEQS